MKRRNLAPFCAGTREYIESLHDIADRLGTACWYYHYGPIGRNERDAVRYDTNEFIAEVKKLTIDYEMQLPRDFRLADTALDRRFRRFVKKWERQEEERWKTITEAEAVFELPDDDEQLVSIESLGQKTWTTIDDLVNLGSEKPGDEVDKRTVEEKEKPAQRQGDDDAAA